MVNFTLAEKRWLEITFYLLCRKVFTNNNSINDVKEFINGFRWTNMFNYDRIIKYIDEDKILLNPNFTPTKQEFLLCMSNTHCRLKMKKYAIKELVYNTEYKYTKADVYKAQMKEEVYEPTLLTPKSTRIAIHETIYSFFLSLKYISDIFRQTKL